MDVEVRKQSVLPRLICINLHRFATSWISMFWFGQGETNWLPKTLACTLEAVQQISTEICAMTKLFLCLLPLALARIIPNIVNQTVFRALTSSGDDVDQLAGFGIAYNMYQLFECSQTAFCTVSQVLINSKRDRRLVATIAFTIALCTICVCLILSQTEIGSWCFSTLFNVDEHVVCMAQKTLGLICANILIQAVSELHAGIVIQAKHTSAILLSSTLNLSVQMLICLSPTSLTKCLNLHPLILPILAIYAGNIIKFLVLVTWYYCRVHETLREESEVRATPTETLSVFLPLAILALARAITVPFARILMGRGLTEYKAAYENAIFSLILPVERLFTSWLNRLKDVYLAFAKDKTMMNTQRALTFTSFCLLISVGFMSVFCGFPSICDAYFHYVFRLSWHFSHLCSSAMSIFIFLPFFACMRAHAVYWLVKEKHTSVMIPCVFLRLSALPLTDFVLETRNVSGGQLAAGLCVTCHGVEAVLLSLVVFYYKRRIIKNPEQIPLLTQQC